MDQGREAGYGARAALKMRLLLLPMITAALLDAQVPSIAVEAVAILKANCEACREVDKPTAALIRDLKRRGLLDHAVVIWGGEFGRTPMR